MGYPPKVDWDTVPELGDVPDIVLAKRFSVSTSTVQRARIKRGLSKHTDWGKLPLGTMPDTEIARIYNKPVTSVASGRQALGIPAFEPERIDWDAQPLGVETDCAIALRLGVSASNVAAARTCRAIPPVNTPIRHPDIDWDAQPLGQMTDAEIAATLGTCADTVNVQRRRRGIPSFGRMGGIRPDSIDWDVIPEFGNAPDGVVAEMYGVTTTCVFKARTVRGIPPFVPQSGEVDWDAVPELGAWPDAWVADKYGVDRSAVQSARMYRGIEAAVPEKANNVAAWVTTSRK